MLPTVEEIKSELRKLKYNTVEDLTQNKLKELLSYDEKTGIFTWKVSNSNRVKVGSIAGTRRPDDYLIIMINKKGYRAHQLAWFYVHGYFPENDIDHINRKRKDNRIKNLREISRQCNLRNSKKRVSNTSGITGIYWHKINSKWVSTIKINYQTYHLGSFIDYNEAVCIRLAAEQCLNWSNCDSNSSAYQYVQKHIINKGVCNESNRI